VSILVAGGDFRVVRKTFVGLVVSRVPQARDGCAGGGYSFRERTDAKFDHFLGSMYSRGVFVLSDGRASSSSRPPADLSESAVGMAEIVCFVGAASIDRVSVIS
jgi:hypothetical protein